MTKLTDARAHVLREIQNDEQEIVRRVAEARRELDRIEYAISQNHRVPSSIGGATHFEAIARDLARACETRQLRYDFQAVLPAEEN